MMENDRLGKLRTKCPGWKMRDRKLQRRKTYDRKFMLNLGRKISPQSDDDREAFSDLPF